MPDLGDLVPLTISVRDANNVPVNATTVALNITRPDGTVQSVPVTNPPSVTGTYAVDYQPLTSGRYIVRWTTTTPTAAFTDTFDVRDMGEVSIVSLPEAKRHLNMAVDRTTEDEEVRSMIEAVTSIVERHRMETIARRSFTETDVMGSGYRLVLMRHPVLSVSSIVDENGVAVPVSQWSLDTQNGILTRTGGGGSAIRYTVTYVAGYQQIPAHYILAAKIILAHIWQTQRIQNIGPQPTLGGQSRRDESIVTPSGMGFAIPHRAIELLGTRPSLIV